MINVNEVTMSVDQSMRRFGTTEIQLALSVSDLTLFFNRDYDPLERYGYKAALYGFGRDGTPSRSNARPIARFGLVIHERQLVCTHFPRFECNWIPQTRVLDKQHFTSIGGETGENNVVMLGQTSLTVAVDDLNVASKPDTVIRFRGQERVIPNPRADSLFCKVQIIDLSHDEHVVVARAESDTFTDFFGADEPRVGVGDNREEPVRPPVFT